jgi:hypothetical protein
MTTSSLNNKEKVTTACRALLHMKRALSDKQARCQKDRTTRTVDRYEKADVDESSSNMDDSQAESASEHDRVENISYGAAQALPLPHVLPSIAGGTKSTMNNMYPTSRHSGFTRPAHETCSAGSASSEESTQQLSSSLLTSDASEEMHLSTPLAGISSTGNTSPTGTERRTRESNGPCGESTGTAAIQSKHSSKLIITSSPPPHVPSISLMDARLYSCCTLSDKRQVGPGTGSP